MCVYNLRPKSTLRLRVQNDLLISRVRLFVISPPRKRVIQKKIRNDKESYALGHGKSRRWRRRWYSRNWHTEYVLRSFACIVSSVRVCIDWSLLLLLTTMLMMCILFQSLFSSTKERWREHQKRTHHRLCLCLWLLTNKIFHFFLQRIHKNSAFNHI